MPTVANEIGEAWTYQDWVWRQIYERLVVDIVKTQEIFVKNITYYSYISQYIG